MLYTAAHTMRTVWALAIHASETVATCCNQSAPTRMLRILQLLCMVREKRGQRDHPSLSNPTVQWNSNSDCLTAKSGTLKTRSKKKRARQKWVYDSQIKLDFGALGAELHTNIAENECTWSGTRNSYNNVNTEMQCIVRTFFFAILCRANEERGQ